MAATQFFRYMICHNISHIRGCYFISEIVALALYNNNIRLGGDIHAVKNITSLAILRISMIKLKLGCMF